MQQGLLLNEMPFADYDFFEVRHDGLYCVTKGNMFFHTFSFSWSADLLLVNLTPEYLFDLVAWVTSFARRDLKLLIFSTKSGFEDLVLRSL